METPSPHAALRSLVDHPARVVVLRALQLGDLLCAIPALRALRAALPYAHVTLVGLPWARAFVDRFDRYLDDFVEFPGYPGLPERAVDAAALPRFLAILRSRPFDLAIQLQGNGRITNELVARFGARRMAGFTAADAASDGWAGRQADDADVVLVRYPEHLSEVGRLLHLVEHLGASVGDERLEFPVRVTEEAEWAALRRHHDLAPRRYACLHGGARHPDRRWSVGAFARVAAALSERGFQIVLTGHGADEAARARHLAGAAGVGAVDLANATSLGVLAALLRDAAVTVCNDTGISHLAAAVRAPSVVVFRTTDPARWAPGDRARHRVVQDGPGAVEAVIDEALRLAGGEDARAA